MKRNLLYYSDCLFFAGCENMLANFFNSEEIHSHYNVYFIYRKSNRYEEGLFSRVQKNGVHYIPIKLPKHHVHRKLLKRLKKGTILYKIAASFIVLFWKYYSIVAAIFPLYSVLKTKDIDLLHINNGGYPAAQSCYSMVIAAKLAGIHRVAYVVNNIAQDYKHPIRWLDWFIDPLIKRNVNLFVTGSKYAANVLDKVLNLKSDKIVSIPNGISPRIITLERKKYLLSLGINDKKLIFSTVALLEERKGHIWLLKALKILKDYLPADKLPVFLFEGEGDQKEQLVDFITANGLAEHVRLIGETKYIFNLINASDVIILPSIAYEDFPNVILEAMSLGKPVIGTNIAGIPEQIDDNKNGFIVPPKDPEALAKAIIKMLDPVKMNNFSRNALQKFKTNYSVEISIRKYLKMYQQL